MRAGVVASREGISSVERHNCFFIPSLRNCLKKRPAFCWLARSLCLLRPAAGGFLCLSSKKSRGQKSRQLSGVKRKGFVDHRGGRRRRKTDDGHQFLKKAWLAQFVPAPCLPLQCSRVNVGNHAAVSSSRGGSEGQGHEQESARISAIERRRRRAGRRRGFPTPAEPAEEAEATPALASAPPGAGSGSSRRGSASSNSSCSFSSFDGHGRERLCRLDHLSFLVFLFDVDDPRLSEVEVAGGEATAAAAARPLASDGD